jgi:hypothetical protein
VRFSQVSRFGCAHRYGLGAELREGARWVAARRAREQIGRMKGMKGVFALRPYQPSARRVYQPAALP